MAKMYPFSLLTNKQKTKIMIVDHQINVNVGGNDDCEVAPEFIYFRTLISNEGGDEIWRRIKISTSALAKCFPFFHSVKT